MGSSPIRTTSIFVGLRDASVVRDLILFSTISCLIRLAVRTPRCGRGNPGSNPGLDIFVDPRESGRLNLQ